MRIHLDDMSTMMEMVKGVSTEVVCFNALGVQHSDVRAKTFWARNLLMPRQTSRSKVFKNQDVVRIKHMPRNLSILLEAYELAVST